MNCIKTGGKKRNAQGLFATMVKLNIDDPFFSDLGDRVIWGPISFGFSVRLAYHEICTKGQKVFSTSLFDNRATYRVYLMVGY